MSARSMISSLRLSVITRPPSPHPQASSNDPVTVTFASLAQLTPSLMRSTGSISTPRCEKTALRIALQAQLELFRPLDTGIWESVSRDHPSGSPTPACSYARLTHIRAMFVSSDTSLLILTTLVSPVSENRAVVFSPTPMVAPMPHGMALMTVIEPWELP